MKFRKKSVVVEAVQLTASSLSEVEEFVGGDLGNTPGGGVIVATLEGAMHVSIGDWIIRGTEGEFYPYKPAAFAATFEPVV